MLASLIAALIGRVADLAPQPVDTTEQGPLGFVLLTVMCVVFVACLFYMDRIRERLTRDDDDRTP
jgi:hypothetical protein